MALPLHYFAPKLTEWVETQSCGQRAGLSCRSDADRHTGVFVQKHYKPFGFLQASIQQGWWQAQEKCFCDRKVSMTWFPGSSLCLPPWHTPSLCRSLLKHDSSWEFLPFFLLHLAAISQVDVYLSPFQKAEPIKVLSLSRCSRCGENCVVCICSPGSGSVTSWGKGRGTPLHREGWHAELFKGRRSKVFGNIKKTLHANLKEGSFSSTDLSLICFILFFKS